MLKKKLFYIADFSLPNKSAYTLHVLKMCDAFFEFSNKNVELLIPFKDQKYKSTKLKKDFLLKSTFKIKSFFLKKKKLNFYRRIIFSIKLYEFLKKKSINTVIISRSIVPSIILAFLNIKNILEIHTELTGFTKMFFWLVRFNKIHKNLKFIFINKYLRKKLKIKTNRSLILNDAVDYRDFKTKKISSIQNTCFYSGSFAKGKCLEIINKISLELPNINFHLYGNENTAYDKSLINNKNSNVFFKGYLTYFNLVSTINHYKVLLMPYQKNVGVLINNLNVANYFSPLKMFDYLASGKIILASNLPVYRNILKHNQNSILIKPENISLWKKYIIQSLKTSRNKLGKRAIKDAKKFSWEKRVDHVIVFSNG